MHYTSWDRADRSAPRLLADAAEPIGEFTESSATVADAFWRLDASDLGASATLADDRVFRLAGNPSRDKRLDASLDGRTFAFICETSGNWIIEDVSGTKVAQFTSKNRGVREAILEFEGDHTDHDLSVEEVAALSWFTRLLLEAKTSSGAIAWIATLVLASLVAVGALFLG